MQSKGEWKVDPDYDWVRREDGRVIANCTGYERDEQRANANLIASAPNLLEMCKAVSAFLSYDNSPAEDRLKANLVDVIAEAEGGKLNLFSNI